MSLIEKLKKVGLKSNILTNSDVYADRDVLNIEKAPIMNVAFGGSLDSGLGSGVTVLAGPSKHFKTGAALLCLSEYLNKYPDAMCLYYDSEFGAPPDYWKGVGIDTDRVLHIPIEDLEQLKHDLPQKLHEIQKNDKIFILVDSVGNLASRKETQDALDGKAVADMTRSREMKSLFRIVTPMIKLRNLPSIFISHTYNTMEMFSKAIVSGGSGITYSADTVIIFGRQQEKDDEGIAGWNFIMNIEKSRFVKEKSKIPLTVMYESGINKYSGILDLALESGHVVKPKNGWYALVDKSTGELVSGNVRYVATQSDDFLGKVLKDESFRKWVEAKYKVVNLNVSDEGLDSFVEDDIEE